MIESPGAWDDPEARKFRHQAGIPTESMPHQTPLLTAIVVGIGIAFLLGALANRLRISPLVGYLLAGVVVSPHTPGFAADQSLVNQLAEIGVILLMFGVGMHFSFKDLLSVRAIAIPGALGRMAVGTLLGMGLAWLLGWNMAGGFVFGMALSVASTVVLLRALQERHLLDSEWGRIAVGWLIVEDLAMVLALVLLPGLAALFHDGDAGMRINAHGVPQIVETVAITLGKVAAFVVLMLVVGRRVIPWILHYVAHTGSRELFRLAVLAIALGVAYGAAELFDVSFALGAFFAGMVLAESELSQQAANETLPLRDAFAVLFFVSVGMLFDPQILVRDPWAVLATLFIILIGKSVVAFLIVLAFRHPVHTAATIAVSLAQIGEFSFILATLGIDLGLMPERGRDLILAGAHPLDPRQSRIVLCRGAAAALVRAPREAVSRREHRAPPEPEELPVTRARRPCGRDRVRAGRQRDRRLAAVRGPALLRDRGWRQDRRAASRARASRRSRATLPRPRFCARPISPPRVGCSLPCRTRSRRVRSSSRRAPPIRRSRSSRARISTERSSTSSSSAPTSSSWASARSRGRCSTGPSPATTH